MANCKGLKGKALKDCMAKNALARKTAMQKAALKRKKTKDSLIKVRHEKRIKAGTPTRSTSFKRKKK